jgi:hypothetical protein
VGEIYIAIAGARVGGPGWMRVVQAGERLDADDGRNSWLLVAQPENWRRQGAPNRWLRCTRPFVVHSMRLGCRLGEVVHAGDPRVEYGGRERFEELPREPRD